jgi:hypothetical protein
MSVFTLTISKRTASFGESKEAERQRIVQALRDAAQVIGSHREPEPIRLNGEVIGEYDFGSDSVNL